MVTRNNLTTSKPAPKASKGYKGIGMEGFIARWYAKNTQKNMESYKASAKKVAGTVAAGSAVLEIAPGPGYLAIELAKLGDYRITGLDISKSFVEIAQKNAKEAGLSIDFHLGNAAQMPFDDETFDFVICTAAFKNFSEPVQALQEMHRVLKPGGMALIGDLRRDAPQAAIESLVKEMGLNRINTLVTRWTFKYMLIGRAYTKNEITEFVSKTQFRKCDIQETLIGMDIWLGK